jgi:23S rRNA pseudouridine2605 synthase
MSGGDNREIQGNPAAGERVAKVIARSGLCSRRDAERLIEAGRVALNGRKLTTPAVTVTPKDRLEVDGELIPTRERTRLWLFHKPRGLVTTNRDPEGRKTVFSALPDDMPRVLTVGRLDINTEGLLLLTNDGGLARVLELPSTGWLRRYRVRAHGRIDQGALDALSQGVTIDGMVYGAVEAVLDRQQGTNVWITVGLREGKNREVKRVLEHLGLNVNRLIRISYGPFQLGDLEEGEVREVRGRVLRDQLGERLAIAAGADFDAPIRTAAKPEDEEEAPKRKPRAGARGPEREGAPGKRPPVKADKEPAPKRKPRAAARGPEREGATGKRPSFKAGKEPAPKREPRAGARGPEREGAPSKRPPLKADKEPAPKRKPRAGSRGPEREGAPGKRQPLKADKEPAPKRNARPDGGRKPGPDRESPQGRRTGPAKPGHGRRDAGRRRSP